MSTSTTTSAIMANPSVRLTGRQDSQRVRFTQDEQPPRPHESLHSRYYHPEIKYDRRAVHAFVQRHTSFRYSNPLVPKPLNLKRANTTVQPREARRPPVSFKPRHVNRLSLEDSLAKPLPRSPPQELLSPEFRHSYHSPSDIGRCGIDFGKPIMLHRSGTMDSLAGGHYYGSGQDQNVNMQTSASMSNLNSNRQYENPDMGEPSGPRLSNSNANASPAPSQNRGTPGSVPVGTPQGSSAHLSGLMCNVHRTTGDEPPPLVGATTTILGDKLYVFGGRVLAKNRPAPLTSDLYELDLIRRHWTKLETGGDVPPPRYFHSMCALGDTKMVCYGGMSPAPSQPVNVEQQQGEVTVMSDIYIYDVSTKSWTFIPAQDVPQGRYAHCACILPSSANFSSTKAPLSALQHNPSSNNPNEGRIGINIDGSGGAQMVIVGGQDGANHYIEQISVFNLRSLKWTSTQPFGKSCGAYRSVAAPLSAAVTARTGRTMQNGPQRSDGNISQEAREPGSSMLIYSNYNFLDVKLELQIRSPDGTLTEWPMAGNYSPPGLRFPNGGVIDTYFVVSGTYLTSSKQEYALWALDLRNLTWSRIDAGGSVFSQGSWNRGVLWNRRNTFVILGNRKRSLVDDYNHRRINFSNVCMVELEAFGFYDNPRKISPLSGFISASSPHAQPGLSLARKAGYTAGGRFHTRASEDLGEKALAMRELADMDIICISGERIAANSRIVGRRWGPYFVQLLRDGTASQDGDTATLRSNPMRASALTITGNSRDLSDISTLTGPAGAGGLTAANASANIDGKNDDVNGESEEGNPVLMNATPSPKSLPPNSRPRCLYLPHTYLTVQALLHFLYTSSLPPTTSPLCSPQILCSLLQIARPYRVDGLLEAVVERLHSLLDSRNAAAVFNATAMAAGGGRGIDGTLNPNFHVDSMDPIRSPVRTSDFSLGGTTANESFTADIESRAGSLSLASGLQSSGPLGDTSASTSLSGSDWGSDAGSEHDGTIWNGELSSVIGLQKRGLRGLMEGRRMRERTGTGNATTLAGPGGQQYNMQGGPRVGLGIAGSLS